MSKFKELKVLIPITVLLSVIIASQLHINFDVTSNTLAIVQDSGNEVTATWEHPYSTTGYPENLHNDMLNVLFYLEPHGSSSVLSGQFNISGSLNTEITDELENISFNQDISNVSARLSQLITDIEILNVTLKTALEESIAIWLDEEFINHRSVNRTTFNSTFSEFYNYYLIFYLTKSQNQGIIFEDWFFANNNSGIIKNKLYDYVYGLTGLNIKILSEYLQTNTTDFPREMINRINPVIEELTGKGSITFNISNKKNYTRERDYADNLKVFFIDNDQSLGGKINNLSLPVDSLNDVITGDEVMTFIHVAVITDNLTGTITRNITWTYDQGTESEKPVSGFLNFVKWVEYGNDENAAFSGLSEVMGLNLSFINHYFSHGANKTAQILPTTIQRYPEIVIEQYNLFSMNGSINTNGFEITDTRFWHGKHVLDSMYTFNDENDKNGILDFDTGENNDWPFIKGGSEFVRRVSLIGFDGDPKFTPPVETEKGDPYSVSFKNMTLRFSDYQANELLADFNLVDTEERTIPDYTIQIRSFPSPSYDSISVKLNTIFSDVDNINNKSNLGAGLSMVFTSQIYQRNLRKISARGNDNSYYDPETNESREVDQIFTVFAEDVINPLVRIDFTELPYLYNGSEVIFPSSQIFPKRAYRALFNNSDIAKQLKESEEQGVLTLFCLLNYPSWNGYGFEHGPIFHITHGRKDLFITEPVIEQENTVEQDSENLTRFYLELILFFGVIPVVVYYTLPAIIKYSKRGIRKKWATWRNRMSLEDNYNPANSE